jgi:regulator of sigma E protease
VSDFLPSLLSNLWAIILVVVFFGGSIFVHELGHFLAARRRGVHVERFSIGFGPPIFKWRGKDGVEYRLSWFPLGGYVLLPQLADLGPIEGESATDVAKLPPVNYATKMIVFVAGATFNILFAFALACLVWVIGQPVPAFINTTQIGHLDPTVKLADGKLVPNPAVEAGIQAGDVVISIDGRRVENFDDIATAVFLGKQRAADGRRQAKFVIERNSQKLERTVYPVVVGDESIRSAGIDPIDDLTVGAVLDGSPAAAAGIRGDDRILKVDGQAIYQRNAISEHIGVNANRPVVFTLLRAGQTIDISVQPRLETDERTKKPVARVGIRYRDNFIIVHPNPFSQIARTATRTFQILDRLISPGSDVRPSQLSGPVGIARELHRQAMWDFRGVLWFTILLNVSLAIFNLLPIPVLDGGQMAFATIARLRGRPLPVNFIVATQSVFMLLFFAMFVYVTVYGDIRRWIRERSETAPTPPAKTAPAQPGK